MRLSRRFPSLLILLIGMLVGIFANGCDDQPTEYFFEPTQRDKSTFARATAEIVNSLYLHSDEAVKYLDQAALTDDYGSLFAGGWTNFLIPDTTTGDLYTMYYRTYLDKKHYYLRFDREPMTDAVRQPSSLDYTFQEIRSYQNRRTSEWYGLPAEIRQIQVEYSNNRTDYRNVDCWFVIGTSIAIEEEIETAGAGTVTIENWIPVSWQFRVTNFSLDPSDQTAHLVFTGVFPIYDKLNQYHGTQGSGEITIDANGRGVGELFLYGDRVAKIYFTNRTFGFNGYFTLEDDNHRVSYQLDN